MIWENDYLAYTQPKTLPHAKHLNKLRQNKELNTKGETTKKKKNQNKMLKLTGLRIGNYLLSIQQWKK